ncbi:hypothetical protein HZH66_009573 [Vespula vulgaris]|uniref:Uncharacterized protein n=1 Tax=Vespula vulgaris TaxID=7454 RepID=A0A834JLJ8_VESVU|nr:hypothetical protein HZH66_009573 [Vespula vulgaris]
MRWKSFKWRGPSETSSLQDGSARGWLDGVEPRFIYFTNILSPGLPKPNGGGLRGDVGVGGVGGIGVDGVGRAVGSAVGSSGR